MTLKRAASEGVTPRSARALARPCSRSGRALFLLVKAMGCGWGSVVIGSGPRGQPSPRVGWDYATHSSKIPGGERIDKGTRQECPPHVPAAKKRTPAIFLVAGGVPPLW